MRSHKAFGRRWVDGTHESAQATLGHRCPGVAHLTLFYFDSKRLPEASRWVLVPLKVELGSVQILG